MGTTPPSEQFGDAVSYSKSGRIIEVVFDRGDGMNALSVNAMTQLRDVARHFANDVESSVIILRGENAFSAGADLTDPGLRAQEEMTLLEQRAAMRLGPDMCQAWADLEQITIAAIEGFCIGGGLALAVACDHRVAADNAQFRLPEVPLGMNMSWRSVPRLTALIGPSKTKEMTILGKKLSGEIAKDWGLVDRVVEPGAATDVAHSWAAEYAALPPIAVRMAKQAIDVSAQPLGYVTSFMDRDQFLLTRQTNDQAEAIAAFLEKRTPKFSGD